MALPDINFKSIRLHHGTQANAFEELCCQLASDEPLSNRARFDRKGAGADGGVECFATLDDGAEIGWQVKYYWDMGDLLKSASGSLQRALATHPAMERFIVCMPFSPPDGRPGETDKDTPPTKGKKKPPKTALEKWTEWRSKKITEAAATGRKIDIDYWGATELRNRLTSSDPRSAGRVAFWFDEELLTGEWFKQKFDRAKDSLGKRYSPETHVDLDVRKNILASTLAHELVWPLVDYGRRIHDSLRSAPATDEGETARKIYRDAASALMDAGARAAPFELGQQQTDLEAALDAAIAWYDALPESSTADPTPDQVAVSNLLAALRSARHELDNSYWKFFERQSMLITGEAGSGKSHLLADACAHQLERDRPALLIIGGQLPDANPWESIKKDLDLPSQLQTKHFLSALNACGETARVRTLIAIDALNEKNGQAIWPERLVPFLHDAAQYPWITVILSCRTTYEGAVIPDALDDNRLPRVVHGGFSYSDALRYLAKNGLTLAAVPNQPRELDNPLFLRICCESIAAEKSAQFRHNLGSLTEVFALYRRETRRRIETALQLNPQRRQVEKAIDALAAEMAATGRGEIETARADDLIRAVHPGDGSIRTDLLFHLQNEGLLESEPILQKNGEQSEIIRFTFERLGDHAIAQHLIAASPEDIRPEELCTAVTSLNKALTLPGSMLVGGLLEALAIQLPEQFDIELPDLKNLPNPSYASHAFEQSLLIRSATSFTKRTWDLLQDSGDDDLQFATLIALSGIPDHPYNAKHLDWTLRTLPMPIRDARWSAYLALDTQSAMRLVEWVQEVEQSAVADDVAELIATTLCWFLTTTHRRVRDLSTKALVAILSSRPALAEALWARFKAIDDMYVTERLMAAIYGAAMQGAWTKKALGHVCDAIAADIFAAGSPPPNFLLRDHAHGIIGYAIRCGALPESVDTSKTTPPYSSPWPIEYVSDAEIAKFTHEMRNGGGRYRDKISASCDDGDFARYVLDPVVGDWSAARRGTDPLPTVADIRQKWLADFLDKATPEMAAAHERLVEILTQENAEGPIHGEVRDRVRAAKKEFLEEVGSDIFEDWRANAEHWRNEGMYQRFARKGAAEFNLAWARRWVCKRAHDLGWSEKLHLDFDNQAGGGRHSHTVERIGKKYQWLALYELIARMSDNLEPLPNPYERGPSRLRNIDPSLLRGSTSDDGWKRFDRPAFWLPGSPDLKMGTPSEILAWLHSDSDFFDGVDNIAVEAPENGRGWLVLNGFETWRGGSTDTYHPEAWRRIGCFVVKSDDLPRALEVLREIHMSENHAVPIAGEGQYRMHLGEYPWAWRDVDDDDEDGWRHKWQPYGMDWEERDIRKGVSIRPTTGEYSCEASGYDESITQNINVQLPAGWLMEALDLRLSDGKSIAFQDKDGVTRFFDPSVSLEGRSAALIEREAFMDLLEREKLCAVWAISGEKNAYAESSSGGFGGRRIYTRLFHSQRREIIALPRYETAEKPDSEQLDKFLAGTPGPDEVDADAPPIDE